MLVTYDGSAFFGFQYQVGVPTVQAEIERALTRLLNHKVRVIGASRTDTGVHALGQVVIFDTSVPIPNDKLYIAINNILPQNIRVLEVKDVDSNFHPRYHAKAKHYRYIYVEVTRELPFFNKYFFQVTEKLDVDLMALAANEFIGRHNFSSFIKSPESKKSNIKEIFISNIKRHKKAVILDIIGDGFGHNMIRNIAKSLYLVGIKKLEISEIRNLLTFTDRKKIGEPAPAGGLYLVKVFY